MSVAVDLPVQNQAPKTATASRTLAQRYTPADAYAILTRAQAQTDAAQLYLDLMKRSLINLMYEDISLFRYDQSKKPVALNRFDIDARLRGEDTPTEALTMIGWYRLSHLEECVKTVLDDNVRGDFIETGVLRGGSAIFLRAALKAYSVTDRNVYACDTFVETPYEAGTAQKFTLWLVSQLLKPLVSLTYRPWRLALFRFLESKQQSFPVTKDPSEDWINMFLHCSTNLHVLNKVNSKDRTSLPAVKSHFARYGLLDLQVIFLKGFFSDTLPKADIEQIAILRCDGDSYESTFGVLQDLYDKVQTGGFIIIDDYNSFQDCKVAVDQFRRERGIEMEIVPIDELSVFWRKEARVS